MPGGYDAGAVGVGVGVRKVKGVRIRDMDDHGVAACARSAGGSLWNLQ